MKDHQAEISGMQNTLEYKFQCTTVCWFWYATAINTDDYFVAGVVLAVSERVTGDPQKVIVPLTALPESGMKGNCQEVSFTVLCYQ